MINPHDPPPRRRDPTPRTELARHREGRRVAAGQTALGDRLDTRAFASSSFVERPPEQAKRQVGGCRRLVHYIAHPAPTPATINPSAPCAQLATNHSTIPPNRHAAARIVSAHGAAPPIWRATHKACPPRPVARHASPISRAFFASDPPIRRREKDDVPAG